MPNPQQIKKHPTGLPCQHPHPSGAPHCTESEWHRGDHYHWPSKTRWPNNAAQPSALRQGD